MPDKKQKKTAKSKPTPITKNRFSINLPITPQKNEKFLNPTEVGDLLGRLDVTSQPLFFFRSIGQEISGLLFPPLRNNSTYHQQLLYPIETIPGDRSSVTFIPGNKHLRRLIEKFELTGKVVRIVYVAKKHTRFGHYEKQYAILSQRKSR